MRLIERIYPDAIYGWRHNRIVSMSITWGSYTGNQEANCTELFSLVLDMQSFVPYSQNWSEPSKSRWGVQCILGTQIFWYHLNSTPPVSSKILYTATPYVAKLLGSWSAICYMHLSNQCTHGCQILFLAKIYAPLKWLSPNKALQDSFLGYIAPLMRKHYSTPRPHHLTF